MEGMYNIKPKIKSVRFPKGKIEIHLKDGRILIAPLSYFPSIREIDPQLRNKLTIVSSEGIVFHHGNEVYHIRDFMNYDSKEFAASQKNRRIKHA